MHITPVTFNWHETDPDQPAQAVLVRLVALTDEENLSSYLMKQQSDGVWTLTLQLPSTLRSSYQICPIRNELADWAQIMSAGVSDPSNPLQLAPGTTYGNPGSASILELSDALPQPPAVRRSGVASGTMNQHVFGEDIVVSVYVPPGYAFDGPPLPLVVLLDGKCWVALDIAATFDNLIGSGRLRPMIVLAVESIHGATRWQSLTHSEIFMPFLVDELLPWATAGWNVTSDPAETVLAGQSLGGLLAAYAARSRPDRFGWVIGSSMALWWPGDSEGGLTGQQVMDSYADGEQVLVRFFLDTGSREGKLLESVRTMRDVLIGRGYAVQYREYEGGHDYACWRGGLADGLVAALGA